MAKQKPGFVETKYDELTYKVNGFAMQVHNELKPGHKEKFYKDRKSTRLNSSHIQKSRMPSSA